jgi:serine/threonine-protein kinase
MTSKTIEIRCAFCHAIFKRDETREGKHPLQFCAYCGSRLRAEEALATIDPSSILLKEHEPKQEEVIGTIGRYLLLKSIGRGGMGEVFLAFDTVCGRRVALKRIRPDFVNSAQLRERFIREARITSQLIHPSIIPIYSIHIEHDLVYYTMPYVAGQTLKQILALAAEQEATDHKTSIPTLMRLFLDVLQAIAYAHSRGVLHRDIKPENVIVGTYGQVIILDWGLTKLLDEVEEEKAAEETPHDEYLRRLTRMGKPVGTVPYMAPERVQGKMASKQTDIYALGVILYQILTLKMPFSRKSMKSFLETWQQEEFVPPEVKAPYRDVPQALSVIVKKCLEPAPENRYDSCDALISHIESFLEGRSEWYPTKSLKVQDKSDWEFQENILLAEHSAITRSSELADWFSVMISKESFSENIRLDVSVLLGDHSNGIGFILCVPGAVQRRNITDGYWLWLASSRSTSRPTTLLRSSTSVLEAPDVVLSPNTPYQIRIEKVEQTISLTINDVQQFVYESHIPVVGTHVGLLAQDADSDVESMVVSIGSQNIMVNCLAVPDAFLASQEYERALSEYRRIGASFSGRAEGRDALFRAGITIIEQGKRVFEPKEKEVLFDLARHEFQKLRHTPGAPLEYLGKALVYQTTGEFEEEVKCFELAFRRYKHHPLLRVLIEHVVLRMHESSRQNRIAAYQFICFVLRFLPEVAAKPSSQKLFDSLHRHWEVPPFFMSKVDDGEETQRQARFCLVLAFWLKKYYVVSEIFEELIATPVLPISHIVDCLMLFVTLDQYDLLRDGISRWRELLCTDEREKYRHLFCCLATLLLEEPEERLFASRACLLEAPQGELEAHILLLLMEQSIRKKNYEEALALYDIKGANVWSASLEEELVARALEALLATGRIGAAEALISAFSLEQLQNEASPLFFFYGCLLCATKGEQAALRHFELTLDVPYPRSWVLGAHVISGKIPLRTKGWIQRSFQYEHQMLVRQLQLYRLISGDESYAAGIELLTRPLP